MIRVVIISNHQQEADILKIAFRQEGFEFYVSKSTEVNYLQLLQYKPDIVLLEISPSYSEQISLIKLLRNNPRFGKSPIVAYGSSNSPRVIEDLLAVGTPHYLTRPLKIKTLLEKMRIAAPNKDWDGEKNRLAAQSVVTKDQELQKLLDSKELSSVKLEIMVRHVGKLLSFPFVIAKILEITDDPKRGADDLAKVINSDPSLCATILKVSNSAFFASMGSKEIKHPKDAIIRLGFNEVKSIAMGLQLMELLPAKDTFGFDRRDFWMYALGRASIAQKLAKHANYPDTALAFLAGLMADFSVLLFDAFFPDVFAEIIGIISEDGTNFQETTRQVLGFAPEDFLTELLISWRLPNDLVDGIRVLPSIMNSSYIENPTLPRLFSDCIAMSCVLTRTGDIGQACDCIVQIPPLFLSKELRLNATMFKVFYDSIYANLSLFADFFKLDRTLLPAVIDDGKLKTAIYYTSGEIGFDPFKQYLSRSYKIKQVNDAQQLTQALKDEKFDIAIVLPSGLDQVAIVKEHFTFFEGQYTASDKALPVLAIWPVGLPSPVPGKHPFDCLSQRSDLRQMTQAVTNLVGI